MQLTANGKQLDVPAGSTIHTLLQQLGMDPSRVAVEHNRAIVPRAGFAITPLAHGDRVEIVQFVGGG
jgi:thiamine biosynthesis protein ThiS